MIWWLWIVIGCFLLVVEILTPGGFFFLFFGIGALLTGGIASSGLVASDSLQWILFSILSVVFLLVFRGRLKKAIEADPPSAKDLSGLVGVVGKATSEIGVNQIGQVEVRGATWSARNAGAATLAVGARCRIESLDGLTLVVKAE